MQIQLFLKSFHYFMMYESLKGRMNRLGSIGALYTL